MFGSDSSSGGRDRCCINRDGLCCSLMSLTETFEFEAMHAYLIWDMLEMLGKPPMQNSRPSLIQNVEQMELEKKAFFAFCHVAPPKMGRLPKKSTGFEQS